MISTKYFSFVSRFVMECLASFSFAI